MFNKLAVIAVLTTVLTACGGSSTPETPPPPPPTGPVTPPPVANSDISKAFVFANAWVLQPLGFGVTELNNQSVNPSPALSNLVAVSANGSSRLAVNFELPVAVTHTQLTPDNRYVYVALDSALNGASGPYAAAIGRYNCAIYRVNLGTDKATCAAEGVIIDSLQNDYTNHQDRPLRFDNQTNESGDWAGASYFVGHTFESSCAGSDTNKTNCSLVEDRTRKLYRLTYDGQLSEIRTSSSFFFSYQVLANGHLAIHGYDEATNLDQLWLYHPDGDTTLIHQGRMNILSADDNNTFMYKAWGAHEPLQAVEVANDGSFNKVPLQVPTLSHLLTSEDGKLYAVNNNFDLHRILPHAEAPLLRFEKPRDMEFAEWWSSMRATPIQITDGFALVVEPELVANAGRIERIWLVNLATGEHQVLLGSDSSAFKARIYNWRVSGDSLLFSALNQATGETVLGELDIAAARDGKTQRDYLKLTVIGSADDPIIHPSDIEVIRPQESTTTSPPQVAITPDRMGGQSIALSFSNPMQRASVAQGITLEDDTGASVDSRSLWLNRTLYLLPDTSGPNTADYAPLVRGQDYVLVLNGVIRDVSGRQLDYVASGFDGNQRYRFSMLGFYYYHLRPYTPLEYSNAPAFNAIQQLDFHQASDYGSRYVQVPFLEVNEEIVRFDLELSVAGRFSNSSNIFIISDQQTDGHQYQLVLEYDSSRLDLTYYATDGTRHRLEADFTHLFADDLSYRNLKLSNTESGLQVWRSLNNDQLAPVRFLNNFTWVDVIEDADFRLQPNQAFYVGNRTRNPEIVRLRFDLHNKTEPFDLDKVHAPGAEKDNVATLDSVDTSYTVYRPGTAPTTISASGFNGQDIAMLEVLGTDADPFEGRVPGSHNIDLAELDSFTFDFVLKLFGSENTLIIGDGLTSLIEVTFANQTATLDYLTEAGMQRVSSDALDILDCCGNRLFRLSKQGDELRLYTGLSEQSLQPIAFNLLRENGVQQHSVLTGADFSGSGVSTASVFFRLPRYNQMTLGGLVFKDASGEVIYSFNDEYAGIVQRNGWLDNLHGRRERVSFADIELSYINEFNQEIMLESLVHFKVGETARMPLPQVDGFTLSHVTGCAGSTEGDEYVFDVVDTTGCTIGIWYQP
ncbi:MAG: hypothetical protein JJU03_07785 [Idiomarina sp.]|nr:hypothetical protein [Idiomarina sp.]